MNQQLIKPPNSTHKSKVVGRGSGSKKGGTSGKGHKGYKSRSGNGKLLGFEGGQMPIIRKLPKVGFSNYPFKKDFQIVKIGSITAKFNEGEEVNIASLKEKNLISSKHQLVKIVGGGELNKKLVFDNVLKVTQSVLKKIGESGSTYKK